MTKKKEIIENIELEEFHIHRVVYAHQGLILEFNYASNKEAEKMYDTLKLAKQKRMTVEIKDIITGIKFIAEQNGQITTQHIVHKLMEAPIYNKELTASYLQAIIR